MNVIEFCFYKMAVMSIMSVFIKELHFLQKQKFCKFFSDACYGKKIKELCTPTWNGVAASVRCVSSSPIVLNAEKKTIRKKPRNPKTRQWCFFRIAAQTLNSCRSHGYACDNKCIIYVSMIYAGHQKNTSMLAKKHLFANYSAAKHQNATNLGVQNYEKNQWTFIMVPHGCRL